MSQGSNVPYITAAAVTTVGVLGGAYYVYQTYKESQRVQIPEKWEKIGTLQNIYVYPVKSCGPVVLDKAECSILGLKDGWLRDRFLMVVNKDYNLVTARANPDLLLVHPSVKGAILSLKHNDMETLKINLAEVIISQKPEKAFVWGVQVPVYDCGQEASEWFSRILNGSTHEYKLMYYASQKSRALRYSDSVWKFTKNDTGALPDEVPYNIINEASIDDLKSRVPSSKVSHRNFRPNFVVSGDKPYDEDGWKFIKVGENVFQVIKPCTRCILTTTDPETGVRDPKIEPLETLKSYRQLTDPKERKSAGTSPRLGLQLSLRSLPGGIISLNDPVYVSY